MKMKAKTIQTLVTAAAMMGLVLKAAAGDVPAQLPRPDGQPGDAKKPVKVYILAGQSEEARGHPS